MNELTSARDHAAHLPLGWQVFCAWCRVQRWADGVWQACRERDYAASLATGSTASHGMCPACFREQMRAVEKMRQARLQGERL